jgi:filamentous hemagglutinin
VADSIKYHFKRHGTEVGASNEWQYLRKAEAFNQNLRGARKSYLPDGRTRYMKDGKYIIKDAEGKIISYGLER